MKNMKNETMHDKKQGPEQQSGDHIPPVILADPQDTPFISRDEALNLMKLMHVPQERFDMFVTIGEELFIRGDTLSRLNEDGRAYYDRIAVYVACGIEPDMVRLDAEEICEAYGDWGADLAQYDPADYMQAITEGPQREIFPKWSIRHVQCIEP